MKQIHVHLECILNGILLKKSKYVHAENSHLKIIKMYLKHLHSCDFQAKSAYTYTSLKVKTSIIHAIYGCFTGSF